MALIPLFPLDVVLFPGVPLPLHIFEPRYRELVSECMAEKKHFGVVRANDNSVAEIGCTAEIIALTKRYDDGRMDIETAGRRRFEIMELNEDRPFIQAEVMFIDDEPGTSPREHIDRAIKLHAEIIEAAGAEIPSEPLFEPDDPQLSYSIVNTLPIDLDFKQTLLAMRSEPERIKSLVEFFEGILPKLRRVTVIRKKAGGNGHVA